MWLARYSFPHPVSCHECLFNDKFAFLVLLLFFVCKILVEKNGVSSGLMDSGKSLT
jgi:hypothetical protein